MRPLPSGTLTLLFSDIEGSTSLLTRLGPEWGEALSAHRRILRTSFAAHSGTELGTEGDSFFVVFTSAQEALQAAVQAQRELVAHSWPNDVPLRVRMGMHTGEPQRHEDGYIGIDVHRAARIAATASGGQIVLSAATRALLAVGPDVGFRDLGWHRLKDLAHPEHLFDVTGDGLITQHPPLRSLGTRANLPKYPTELIGRDSELHELCELIRSGSARLVTLTGPGGTGKTRLAVAAANELRHRLHCDTYFVPLHTADGPTLMWAGIADAVGAPADAAQSPQARAMSFLANRAALLILDNLEQIRDADVVVSGLLNGADKVVVLATSRRPLHLVEEHLFPVPTLGVPQQRHFAVPEQAQTGAVELFVRRARMVKPGFTLTPDNVADVVGLCRRLDGLPLAVELAAARIRLLSPRALAKRLDDRLGEAGPVADRVERQRTLASTIAWSYDLLEPADQAVFRTLGIFSSRFDLDAVDNVVQSPDQDPLDVVAHLVDVSLIEVVDGPDGEPMAWMLQTVRRFARRLLREAGDYDGVRLRHARWCLQVAQQISGLLGGAMQMSALDRMDAVEEDIRAALAWCLAPTGPVQSERLACGLDLLEPMYNYWYRFGHVAEGRAWHDLALQRLGTGEVADSEQIVDALHGQGVLALQQNDVGTAERSLERAFDMANRLGDPVRRSREANSLGVARREAGDLPAAKSLIETSLELARQIGDPHREATALANMVHIHMDAGDYQGAVVAAQQALVSDRELGDPWGVAIDQSNLVFALLSAQGPQRALQEMVEVAPDAIALRDAELSIDVLETFACVWAGLGDAGRAARFLGAAEHQRDRSGIPRLALGQRHLDRWIEPARASLPESEWRAAYREGARLTIEAAVAQGVADAAVSSRSGG